MDIETGHDGRQGPSQDGPPPPKYDKGTKDDAVALLKWIDSGILYNSPYRIRQHRVWRKADLYKQAKQIIVPSYNEDPTQTPHWAVRELGEDQDADSMPIPVYDEYSSREDNETARLAKPEYEPYVRPTGDNPDLKARNGAHKAEDALHNALDEMNWSEQRERGCSHIPHYGGWFVKSVWETSWEKTVRIPVDGAMRCPDCGMPVASKSVPEDKGAEMHMASPGLLDVEENEQGDRSYSARHCLQCQDHAGMGMVTNEVDGTQSLGPVRLPGPPSLKPFTPVDQELDEQDFFGRPLGQDVPLGEWKLKTIPPYDIFVDNLGIGVPPGRQDEWWESHVETVEWIRMRYENGAKVKPERASQLLRFHPIAGERGLYYSGTDGGLFTHHSRVKEYHHRPWRVPEKDENGQETGKLVMNRGRSAVMSNGVVLFDGDFLIESKNHPGTYIERTHLEYIPGEERSGGQEQTGVAMVERLGDPQDNLNEIKAQFQDCRQGMGTPHWSVTRDMDFGYKAGGSSGGLYVWDPNPLNPNLVPREIGNTLLNSEAYREIDSDLEFMDRAAWMNEMDRGEVPTGADAALTLQVLAEQSGEHRKPLMRRIKEAQERLFRHGLELMYELVREPRLLWKERGSGRGKWSQESWTGIEIAGQTQVVIDVEPAHESSLIKEQKLRDFVNLNPAVMQDPRVSRMLAREFGVSSEMFAAANLQDEAAEREFLDFRDMDKSPVVDASLDDHLAHYQRHGIDWHGEWARDQEEIGGWDRVLPFLWNWEAKMEDQPGPPDPTTGAPTMIPGLNSRLDALGVPQAPDSRIQAAWAMLIKDAGHAPQGDELQSLTRCIKFRAHMDAHKIVGEGKQAAAQAGDPQAAAPQAPATEAGTMPVPGTGQDASNVGPGETVPMSPGLPQLQNTPSQAPPPA